MAPKAPAPSQPIPGEGPGDAERESAPVRLRYPHELTPQEIAELHEVLPDEMAEAHLRWLETGEGDPWGESSG